MKNKPYKLTLAKVLRSVNKAIENKTIQFLAPKALQGAGCAYGSGENDKYRCAVGSALPKYVINKLKAEDVNDSGVLSIRNKGYIEVDENEIDFISAIQSAHDNLVGSHRTPKGKIAYMKEEMEQYA